MAYHGHATCRKTCHKPTNQKIGQISWTPRTEVQLSQAGRDGAWLPAAPGGQAGDSLGSEDAKDEATRGRWGSKKGTDMRKGWACVYYFLVIDLGVS